MTLVAPVPHRPNLLLPRAPAPWRAPVNLGLPAALQILLQRLGGTFHTYHPFRRPRRDSDAHVQLRTPISLLLTCRNVLVTAFGLRGLRRLLRNSGVPRAVCRLISTVGAAECEALSAAPLTDVFAQPFFHRAVTWRVTCSLDRQPYLTTYAVTSSNHGYCVPWGGYHWLGWAAEEWFWVDNEHVMSVWGVVYDEVTGNAFYLMDTPIATLDQIHTRLTACGCSVPEELVWTVIYQVSTALLYMVQKSLSYTAITLDNVFLLRNGLALENMLSRKRRLTGCSCELYQRVRGSRRAVPSERCYIHYVGHIIFALITCHLRSEPVRSPPPCSPVDTLKSLKHLYSPQLLRLLSRTLAGEVSLAWGTVGGGGDGRVADRTVQWETQWEKQDPEFPLGSDAPYHLYDHTGTDYTAVSPLYPCLGLFLQDGAVTLAQIVGLSASIVTLMRPGSSLREAVSTSSQRLISHVLTAQKSHLRTK